MSIFETAYCGSIWHHGIKGQKWGVRRTPEELGHVVKEKSGVAKFGFSGTIEASGHYISEKGFAVHPDKIAKFCLKPGAKHYNHFSAVGYTPNDSDRLLHEIENQFDMAKKRDSRLNAVNKKEEFSISMQLGITEKHTFRTTWINDRPDGLPRFISAYHDEDLGKKER